MYRGRSNAKLPKVDQTAASDGCHIASEAVKAQPQQLPPLLHFGEKLRGFRCHIIMDDSST